MKTYGGVEIQIRDRGELVSYMLCRLNTM